MEISGLKYLLAVAEAGSIAAAARLLNLHPSTLSRHIFAVEEELGTTLFERKHSGVRLTSSGHDGIIHVRHTLADLDALVSIGRSSGVGKQGRIRLGVHMPPMGIALSETLSRWRSSHRDVELSLHELPDGDLCKTVRNRQLDVVLIAEHALGLDLVWVPISRERLLAAVPSLSPMAQETASSWEGLRREPVLVQDWPQSHLTRAFYSELFGHGTQFQSHAASKQSILALVSAGFGITLATESQARAGFPGVTFIPIAEDNASINIVLAWTPQSEDPAVGRFIAFMRDEVRSHRSL